MLMTALKGVYSREFRASLKRNKDNLKTEFEIISEELKSRDERYLEYEKKLAELLKKSIEYNADGSPVQLAPGRYKLKADQAAIYKFESDKLDNKYSEAIEKRKLEVKENEKWLDEEIEINIDPFNENSLPEDIGQDEFELLLMFCEK
jgi:hypothetical protein